jgi:Na+/H+-dicarboxylate symporter
MFEGADHRYSLMFGFGTVHRLRLRIVRQSLDGTATCLSLAEQLSLLVIMIIASKGAAGGSGAGLASLASGLHSHRPELLDGIGLIVGIDRLRSEAHAVTNFSGNAVAIVLVGAWTQDAGPRRHAGDAGRSQSVG